MSTQVPEAEKWENVRDDDIMQQQSAIQAEEAGKSHLLVTRIFAGYNKSIRVFEVQRPGREFENHSNSTREKREAISMLLPVVTSLIGLQHRHVIIHFKDHKTCILLWLIPPPCLMFMGTLCHILGMHINKGLYSFSYTCVTAGVAGILFATIYMGQVIEWSIQDVWET